MPDRPPRLPLSIVFAAVVAFFSIVASSTLGAVAALATSPLGSPCSPQPSIVCSKSNVADKLAKENASLSEKGFRPTEGDRISVVDKDGAEEFRLELESGVDYAFIAACGSECAHVGLNIMSEKQEQLAASAEKEAVVILNGTVASTGTYIVNVSVPGCTHIFCGVGLSVMRK